jgi:hypothetical protein
MQVSKDEQTMTVSVMKQMAANSVVVVAAVANMTKCLQWMSNHSRQICSFAVQLVTAMVTNRMQLSNKHHHHVVDVSIQQRIQCWSTDSILVVAVIVLASSMVVEICHCLAPTVTIFQLYPMQWCTHCC